MTEFQSDASLFAFNITQLLKLDEEYRQHWRYKHKQDPLKEPIRQAVKNTKSWASKMAGHLELTPEPDQFERYTIKTWTAWETYSKAREAYLFGERTAETLKALRDSEKELKVHTKALNHLINTINEK